VGDIQMLVYILVVVLFYLLGNISSSYIISKYVFDSDIRTKGSKNAGTTNALRVFGFKAGLLTFLGDYFKGTIAVLLTYFVAKYFKVDVDLCRYLAALAVVLGHDWPVFLKFRGGKGVATTYGAMLAISPLSTLFAMLFFIVIVGLTRYVSIGSILGVFLFPIFMYIRHDSLGVWTSVILFLLVVYRHRENIYRLINGEERRIDFNRKK